jgi:hypothetical protein
MVYLFIAAIANIGSLFQPPALFLFKIPACFVTGGAGSTFDSTQDDLATGIGFLAMIAVDAEVFCIVKSTFMIPI